MQVSSKQIALSVLYVPVDLKLGLSEQKVKLKSVLLIFFEVEELQLQLQHIPFPVHALIRLANQK